MVDKCPKCGGQMKKGLILTPGGVIGARWGEGEKFSKWFTLLHNKPRILAYSCEKCGFVELYVERK